LANRKALLAQAVVDMALIRFPQRRLRDDTLYDDIKGIQDWHAKHKDRDDYRNRSGDFECADDGKGCEQET
jgi:hypothetical protein